MTEDVIPKEAKDFVDRIVPKKFQQGKYVSKRGRIMINKEFLTPDDVLKQDPFFNEFRNHKLKNKEKKKYTNLSPNSKVKKKKYILSSED